MMQIKQEEQTAGGRFVAVENGVEIGHLDYEWDDKQCFGITHTVVEKAFEGNNTVMVHIRRLREKIEMDARNAKIIKTVWGVGYKIEK